MAGAFRIELKGKSAAAALIVVCGLLAFDIFYSSGSFEEEALENIRNQLAVNYALAAASERDMSDPGQEDAEAVLAALNVSLKSVSVKGFTNTRAVRVEPIVNGGPPPDGRRYRYFKAEYSNVFGWQYPIETSALYYYLKLF